MSKPIGIVHFLQFLHLMREREEVACAPEPDPEPSFDIESNTYRLSHNSNPDEIIRWLKWRGYRVVAGGTGIPGGVGVVFGRKNGQLTMAVLGDVLEYDGVNVVVIE